MDLSYNELSKRDIINVADGRCLGRICDAMFSFPKGILTGIFVPSRKNKGLFWFFDKSKLFISVSQIVKIGGDVILVNVSCGDNCLPNVPVHNKNCEKPSKNPCPPPCSPCNPCPPPCSPKNNCSNNATIDLSGIFDESGRIDLDDY